jgi:nitrogen regulatory protein PII 1
MKMIRAIIRPNREAEIIESLEKAGFISLTKIDVFGRGKQGGVTVGDMHYDELPKTMLMLVVENEKAKDACEIIQSCAKTGKPGDGKIFITPVEESYTVRTGELGL